MNEIQITEEEIINAIHIKEFIKFYTDKLDEIEREKLFKVIRDAIYDCYCDNEKVGITIGDKVFWQVFSIQEIHIVYIKDIITDKIYYQEID